jgi:hypothetical protein
VGDRTIHNHVSRINTLLKSYGVVNLLSAADWPKYHEKDVTAHNSDELASLFACVKFGRAHSLRVLSKYRLPGTEDHVLHLG